MKPLMRSIPLCLVVASSLLTGLAFAQSPPSAPASSHVFFVMLENTSYGTMTNSGNSTTYMPQLVALGNTYAHTTNYITNSGGSLLAYLWVSSGYCHSDPNSTASCPHPPFPAGVTGLHSFGCTGGACINPATNDFWPITDDNIYREMINHTPSPIAWKLYAESIPYAGYTGPRLNPPDASSAYDPHHNGPLWYSDVGRDSAHSQQQLNMVPFTQFSTDLQNAQLPQYSIIVPNDNHDAHDGSPKAADDWLQANVFAPLLSQPFFQPGGDGVLIVTFDNDDSDGAGLVYTAVIGPQVKRGYVSNNLLHHEDTLLTILQELGIAARPGYTAIARGFGDFFVPSAPTAVLSTKNLAFGNQAVGVATARTLTLSNSGNAPLVINSISVTAGASDYSKTDCGNSIAPGAYCTVTVKFTPTVTGLRSGMITFKDSVKPDQTVSLSGTGVSQQTYTLTVSKSGTGAGTVTSADGSVNCGSTCVAVFSSGSVVTLTPTATSGSSFAGWGGACSGTQACSVTMSAAQSVSATFTLGTGTPPPPRPAGAKIDLNNPLATSLVGLFLMNEGSGTTDLNLVDNQTASFAGSGPPTWNTTDPSIVLKGGSSLNSYVNAGADLTFDKLPISKVTVVARVFVNAVTAAGIAEKNDGNIDSGFIFGWDSSGALRMTMEKSSANTRVATPAGAIVSGQWMQLAFTWDGTVANASAAHLFLNGAEQTKATSSDGSGTLGYANATNQPLRIGNASFDNMAGSMNGKMAYFVVYKGRILSASELKQLDAKLPLVAAAADVTGTVTPNGSPTSVTTATPGQNVRLTFAGTAGQKASIQITGNTLGSVTASLLAPDGTTLASNSSSSSSFTVPGQTLASAGTYTVYIHPGSATTGSISVAVTLNNASNRPPGAVLDTTNPLSTNLAGLFLMNEGSGTTDKNLVNGGIATFSGTAAPSWNTTDPSIVLKGGSSLNSYVNAGADLTFDKLPISKITVVARVFVSAVTAAGIAEKNDGNIDSGFIFGWDSSGALRMTMEKSSANMRVATPAGAIVSGQWMQLAFTWDGTVANASAAHLFLNGVEQTKATSSDGSGTLGYANATNQPLRIGNASFDNMAGSMNGKMAYFAVYKGRILSASELKQLEVQLPIR